MSFLREEDEPTVCPKTGKIIKSRRYGWVKWLFPLSGLAALIWFLIRVIPKPSRATYPCQRVAFPVASGFIVWLTGALGSIAAFRNAKVALAKARYTAAAVCIIASVGFVWLAMNSGGNEKITIAHEPRVANKAMGTGIGVVPGRVAWIHDANATNWNGPGSGQNWFSSTCTNQGVVDNMVSKAVRALAGAGSDAEAWDVIFHKFNKNHGRGDVGYQPGEKIGIKINMTLTFEGNRDKPTPSWWTGPAFIDLIDNSPQLAVALLDQLVNVVGVSESDISIGDPIRVMPNYWYNIVHAAFPNVVYVDKLGGAGRTAPVSSSVEFYWSTSAADSNTQDYIPTCFADAEYFVNFSILKSHDGSGITLGGKNNYGSLRGPQDAGYYDLHLTRAADLPGMGHYRAIVDLMGHRELGGKTLVSLIDGLFAGQNWSSEPVKWNMAPFNNDWPSSIFLSMDQVAADSVGADFLYTEWTTLPRMSGADDYLHEAALANDPCSHAVYDPEDDGSRLASLGVHEHWNDSTNKQYSGNLGLGNGIELATASVIQRAGDFNGDNDVDFRDFAVLAAAWKSQVGDANWDARCDIASPGDGIIDGFDLAEFCENWLTELDLIAPGATLQQVYSATSVFFEGPTYDPARGNLYFSRRTSPMQLLRLDSPGSASVWMSDSNSGNGTCLSLEGRLLVAEEVPARICSYRIGASVPEDRQVLATPAKKPNDLCQLTNGNIYFTCPDWGTTPANQGVYLLEPNGVMTLVKNGLYQPNGVVASIDGTKLYVSESASGPGGGNSYKRWWVYPINANGTLGTGSVFFQPGSPPNYNDPDGMTIDEYGNLYFTGMGGVWIVSPAGVQLAMISVTQATSNVTFGGPDNRTLFITCQDKVYSLAMNVRGGEPGGSQIPDEPEIPETGAAPTIDGTVDAVWANAEAYPLNNILLGSVSNSADLSGEWRALWDTNNLYVLVDVNDDAHYNDSGSSTPWEDDAVELYIDADSSRGASYDGTNDYELVFRWNDPGVIHLGVNSATNTTGMTFIIVNRTGGHRFEAKLPWSAMGVAPGAGSRIGLDVHLCDDDDGGTREAKKAWWTITDDSWQYPYLFADVLLTGTTPPPPPPPPAGIVFDAASSAASTAGGQTLTWSHTIGSGSNRILSVGTQCEDTVAANMVVQSVTYNGVGMTRAGNKITGTSTRLSVELWYLLDANLPASGTYNVVVTYTGSVSDRIAGAISIARAKQAAPEDVNSSTAASNPISITVNSSAGAWVIDSVGCGNPGTNFTPLASGMVERYDVSATSSNGAGCTKPVSTAGSTIIQWSNSSVNRMALVAGSFAKAP